MAQNKLFYAVFIFLALVFILKIQSFEGRLSKFHPEKVHTHNRFLIRETEKGFEGGSRFGAADVQSLPAAPLTAAVAVGTSQPPSPREVHDLTPTAAVGASQPPPPDQVDDFRRPPPGHSPGIAGRYIEAADANVWYPPPPYLDRTAFSVQEKVNPFPPPAPRLNPPTHHSTVGASQAPPPSHSRGFTGHYIEGADANVFYPPPPYLDRPPAAPLTPAVAVRSTTPSGAPCNNSKLLFCPPN